MSRIQVFLHMLQRSAVRSPSISRTRPRVCLHSSRHLLSIQRFVLEECSAVGLTQSKIVFLSGWLVRSGRIEVSNFSQGLALHFKSLSVMSHHEMRLPQFFPVLLALHDVLEALGSVVRPEVLLLHALVDRLVFPVRKVLHPHLRLPIQLILLVNPCSLHCHEHILVRRIV